MRSKEIGKLCRSDVSVVIAGPEGCGKTWLARRIHEGSRRYANGFVVLNLAALVPGQLKRQVTDSLSLARGGTLVLEALGTLRPPEQLQVLIVLRLWQSHHDVRLVVEARPSKDEGVGLIPELQHWIGEFRLRMPALIEQPEEFGDVLHACLEEVTLEIGRPVRSLSEAAALSLETHDWPGNLRELRKVLESAVRSSREGRIDLHDIPVWSQPTPCFAKNQARYLSP